MCSSDLGSRLPAHRPKPAFGAKSLTPVPGLAPPPCRFDFPFRRLSGGRIPTGGSSVAAGRTRETITDHQPGASWACGNSSVRYRRRVAMLARLHDDGRLSEAAMQQRLTAMTAFLLPVRSHGDRRRALATIRSAAIGLEPGAARRQLAQQTRSTAAPRTATTTTRATATTTTVSVWPAAQTKRGGCPATSMGLNRPPPRSQPHAGRDKPQTHPRPVLVGPSEAVSKAPGGGLIHYA